MNGLLTKLKENKFSLIASLPENSYELAKIAWEAGVDAIKVHCGVFHNASQNNFGPLEEYIGEFMKILKDSPVPVGIVAGSSAKIAEAILTKLPEIGFDFVSLYAHDTPASFYHAVNINNFLSVDSSYNLIEIDNLLNGGYANILELSIIDKEKYGDRLNARDLSSYKAIAALSDIPCVVPSQKLIFPEDVEVLYETGVKAVMVGAIVLGKEKNAMKKTLIAFRNEIDKL